MSFVSMCQLISHLPLSLSPQELVVWIGRDISNDFCIDVFGKTNYSNLPEFSVSDTSSVLLFSRFCFE